MIRHTKSTRLHSRQAQTINLKICEVARLATITCHINKICQSSWQFTPFVKVFTISVRLAFTTALDHVLFSQLLLLYVLSSLPSRVHNIVSLVLCFV
jgi:hypothetical protein